MGFELLYIENGCQRCIFVINVFSWQALLLYNKLYILALHSILICAKSSALKDDQSKPLINDNVLRLHMFMIS